MESHHAGKNVFPYRPLETSTSIRVVCLQPGTGQDDIEMNLEHRDVEAREATYEALSYVWGDPLQTKPISCDGHRFYVTTNLFLALTYLRKPDETRYVWIDAVCINQMDVAEINQQVALMAQIYPRASQVIIWTGKSNDAVEWAADLIANMQYFLDQHPNPYSEEETDRHSIRQLLQRQDKFTECAAGAVEFLQNPWFYRSWTFQEAYLSKKAEVVCGNVVFSWFSLVTVIMYMFSLGLQEFTSIQGNAANFLLSTCLAARYGEGDQKKLRLSNVLRRSMNHLASDPRDRIFAFLAMVDSWQGKANHNPDYMLTVDEVYIQFARLILREDGHFQLLSDAWSPNKANSLPSWVPDWRSKRGTKPLSERFRNFPLEYNVNAGCAAKFLTIAEDVDSVKLHLQGAEIDVVDSVVDITALRREADPYQNLFGCWRRILSSFRYFFQSKFPDIDLYRHTCEEASAAFIRTLAADHLPFSERDDTQVKEWFPVLNSLMKLGWREALASSESEAEELHLPSDSLAQLIYLGGPADEIHHALFTSHFPKTWIPLAVNKSQLPHAAGEVLEWIHDMTKHRVFLPCWAVTCRLCSGQRRRKASSG